MGSGFGLYGYLPALIEHFNEDVVLPETYRSKILARPELTKYFPRLQWASDHNAALDRATGAVLAVPPSVQQEIVARCCARQNIKVMFLEKPVAVSPVQAVEVLSDLRRAHIRFRVGYSFLYANWMARAVDAVSVSSTDRLNVDWSFMAHHFANELDTWKARHSAGGGVLRFFGIHVIAMLANWGYRAVDESRVSGIRTDHPQRWDAVFSGPGLARARVYVDSRSTSTRFSVMRGSAADEMMIVEQSDPFSAPDSTARADRRVPVIKRLLDSMREDDAPHDLLYDSVNALWQKVEALTHYSYRLDATPAG